MSLAGYIVLGIIILILLLVYFGFVIVYIGTSMRYREAQRVTGRIQNDLGDFKLSTGSSNIGVCRYRTYHRYLVSFPVDGVEVTGEAELKNRKLKVGDKVEVRYELSKEGTPELVSQAYLCWLREMSIGYTLGIILGVVLAICKSKGMLD